MLQKTDFNTSPFFDDYDENKDFLSVAFRAGHTLQTRELNQLQTILQTQIKRIGSHLFKEGSLVVGGVNAVRNIDTITGRVVGDTTDTALRNMTEQLFIRVIGSQSGAKIALIQPKTETKPTTIVIDYASAGVAAAQVEITAGAPCEVYYRNTEGTEIVVANFAAEATGKGVLAKTLDGIHYFRGRFIRCTAQTILVSAVDELATTSVGYNVVESVVTEKEDSSLYSNASGEPNFKAAGAARLKIALNLVMRKPTDVDENFIELLKFENGVVQKLVNSSEYSTLMDELARRTYEESGDYVVDQFPVETRDHLRSPDFVDGVFPAEDGGDESKYVVRVKGGTAYVRGYRVGMSGYRDVIVDKARDVATQNNVAIAFDGGSYIIVNGLYSLPMINLTKRFNLLGTGDAVVGTTTVRGIRKDGANYQVYLMATTYNTGKSMTDVKKISFTDGANKISATLVQSVLFNSTADRLIVPIPYGVVKSLKENAIDTNYTVLRSFEVTTDSAGKAAITLPSSELFSPINSTDYIVAHTGASNAGTVLDATQVLSLSGSPVGRQISISASGALNMQLRIVAPVYKSVAGEKNKVITVESETFELTNVAKRELLKADIYRIVKIVNIDTNVDVTEMFAVDNGQRATWIQAGEIATRNGMPITMKIRVDYEFFRHSAGDYASIDSYGGLSRNKIPKFVDSGVVYDLSNCMDFRPLKVVGGFDAVGGELVKPLDMIRLDVTSYLPRVDALYVSDGGEFAIVKGISGHGAQAPNIPVNAMRLAVMEVPAYTNDVSTIRIAIDDNRRFTMRDIGEISKRVDRVEYYTSLSMLENKTAQMDVIDPTTGNNRFKNGFAVDGFTDLKLADFTHPDFSAMVAFQARRLVPYFLKAGVSLQARTHANTEVVGELVTIKPTGLKVIAAQPYASMWMNVNPYAVFTWNGTLTLTPTADYWKDIHYAPPRVVIVNQTNQVNTTTTSSSSSSSSSSSTRSPQTQVTVTSNTTQSTSSSTSSNTVSADESLSTVSIPFMRAFDVRFAATGFRPFVKLNGFFEGVNVNTCLRQDGKLKGEPVVTDAAGDARGVFSIPNTAEFRFSCGDATLLFTDATSSAEDAESSTKGSTGFTSIGELETKRTVNTTTNTTTVVTNTNINTNRHTTTFRRRQSNGGRGGGGGKDPIAQTFVCGEKGGAFVHSVDVYFKTKAKSVPVFLQIRECVAGFPQYNAEPFGEKAMYPANIAISNDGTAKTRFVFDSPVYLKAEQEYAIVLLADTQEYNAWIAEMGQNAIGQNLAIAKQPHLGVFMTSSNGNTWSPNQLQDLKFEVNANVYDKNGGEVIFGATAPEKIPLGFNPMRAKSGTSKLEFFQMCHGLKTGDQVELSGVSPDFGLSESRLAGRFVVRVIDQDNLEISISETSNATGSFGGGAVHIISNHAFSQFIANLEAIEVEGTRVEYAFRYMRQDTRTYSDWFNGLPQTVTPVSTMGVLTAFAVDGLQVKAKFTTSQTNLTPFIDTVGLFVDLDNPRVNNDTAKPVYRYITKKVMYDNPSTGVRFYTGAILPSGSNMRFFVKPVASADADMEKVAWVELKSTAPIINSDGKAVEYQYNLSGVGSFVGYVAKVEFTTPDAANYPQLVDFRSIALA